jgi:hypothetical protein
MTDEKREQTIGALTDMMRNTGFEVEFAVKKKPNGIRVIIEVTQDQMEGLAKQVIDNSKRIEKV